MSTDRSLQSSRRRIFVQQRGLLFWLGLPYLLFVIYGSLVPLDYHAIPWEVAVLRFSQIPFLDIGIDSRADWVANCLLFIPLTFFWTGALARGRGTAWAAALGVLIFVVAAALSVGIEFTQEFFPQRTVSQNDIAAETLGGLIGVVCWWGYGAGLMAWHEGWKREREPAGLAERAAWVYLAVALAYGILPLDLTLSAVEIYHKWNQGKVVLIPFSGYPADPAHALYQVITDILLWAPLAWLWCARPGRDFFRVWWMTLLAAVSLGFMQLFVYSRVTDVTVLFTSSLGAVLGAWLGGRQFGGKLGGKLGGTLGGQFGGTHAQPRRRGATPAWMRLLAALAWVPVLLLVFWYPFDFRTDSGFVQERMSFLQRVPFEAYYFGTEFRAATEVFHKLLFFAPQGALLAWWVSVLSWRWRSYAALAVMLALAVLPMGIEYGQVFLPDKVADTTDWLLETMGGMLGYFLFRTIHKRLAAHRQVAHRRPPEMRA